MCYLFNAQAHHLYIISFTYAHIIHRNCQGLARIFERIDPIFFSSVGLQNTLSADYWILHACPNIYRGKAAFVVGFGRFNIFLKSTLDAEYLRMMKIGALQREILPNICSYFYSTICFWLFGEMGRKEVKFKVFPKNRFFFGWMWVDCL